MKGRGTGSLISDRMGESTTYALYALQERGKMFINPQTKFMKDDYRRKRPRR
jgi:predicted membrane GTPase involved in stress response